MDVLDAVVNGEFSDYDDEVMDFDSGGSSASNGFEVLADCLDELVREQQVLNPKSLPDLKICQGISTMLTTIISLN